jgi:hypothetical protein
MKKWPNIGERIKERIVSLGFQHYDGRPNVGVFSLQRDYNPVYLYRWIGGATPDYENIIRLARDLEVSPCWLMFGEEGTLVPTLSARRVAGKKRAP